jgi:hypothetical protein
LGISTDPWGKEKIGLRAANSFLAVLRGFRGLARGLQIVWHSRRAVPPGTNGRQTMTNNANLQQLALSIFGALFASALAISAAVGPVVPII